MVVATERAEILESATGEVAPSMLGRDDGLGQCNGEVILEAKALTKHFPVTRGVLFSRLIGTVKAVDGIDFDNCWKRSTLAQRCYIPCGNYCSQAHRLPIVLR